MIPYLRSIGDNTITCSCDLVILDDSKPILISLIDYGIKTKKVVSDIVKEYKRNTLTLEDREDNLFKKELRLWNESFNFKNDRIEDLTHTIIKNKHIKDYIIDWDNTGKINSIVNYLRNVEYLPVTHKLVKDILDSNKYNWFLNELDIYTSNKEFKNLKAYKLNVHYFKEQLEKISQEIDANDDFNWENIDTIDDYIFTFLNPIKNKISETVKILYDKNNIYDGIYNGISPLDGQVPIIQSALEVLKRNKFIYIGAEQGMGKSIMGAKINHNYFKMKNSFNYITLIVAPAITLTQWEDEIKKSFNDNVDIKIIKKTEEFIKCYKQKRNMPLYILIGKETFKLGYTKKPVYNKTKRIVEYKAMDSFWKTNYYSKRDYMYSTRKEIKEVLVCPICGLPLKNPNRTSEDVFFEDKDFKKPNKGNYKCSNCKSVLWSATYNKTKKTSVIDYIHRKHIIFDSVIIDEAHESNNSGSIIGNSTRTLMRNHAKKIVALSGTSNNGYASSLHNLLMAICPNKLIEDECLNVTDFVRKYGTLQAITQLKDERRSYYSRGKSEIKDSEFKEIEGINPIVFTKYLASNSIFATLDELGNDLPDLKEEYIAIEPENEQIYGQNRLYDEIKKGDSFNAKMYVDSIIKHYINNPYSWDVIPIETKDKKEYVNPKNLSYELLPKEKELINIAKKENMEGRKTWVYCEFNGGGSYMKGETLPDRLQRILEAQGLKVFQLRASVPTYDRKEVIEKNKDKYDVFISNPKLVNVGLNLVFCPTYIFYMPSYKVNVVSQASRRGYRANSTMENRIYHMYYKNTWEDDIIKRYQRKLAESKAINGQFDVTIEEDPKIRTASQFSSKLNSSI